MFTSRAEYRILLRQDNADLRLTPIAHRLGVIGADIRMDRVREKQQAATDIDAFFRNTVVSPDAINGYLETVASAPTMQKTRLHNIILRPQADILGLAAAIPELEAFLANIPTEFVELAEINMKYDGYIQKEREMVEKVARLENLHLSETADYGAIHALSIEARHKLSKLRPRTIGQASRISGVSPADISVLLIHLGR